MNKTELVAALAEKTKLTKKEAESALSAFVETVSGALVKGEKVSLIGFGTFDVGKRAAPLPAPPAIRGPAKKSRSKPPRLLPSSPAWP